jgi:hypothetical protein
MEVFFDIITGDELFSDSYKPELIDDVVYKVKCSYRKLGSTQVDIGANKSVEGQEEEEEAVDDQELTVIDLVDAFRLQEASLDKTTYRQFLKDYFSTVKGKLQESNPERVAAFQEGAKAFMGRLPKNLDETFRFYLGESNDIQGMIVLMEFEGDNIYAYFWRDGIKCRKF